MAMPSLNRELRNQVTCSDTVWAVEKDHAGRNFSVLRNTPQPQTWLPLRS